MIVLEFKTLQQIYDGRVVLDIRSLSVERGSKAALVGSNGAGKTTLLEIAALLKRPSSGEIFINGKQVEWHSLDHNRSDIAFIAQDPYFFTGSLNKNMAFALTDQNLSPDVRNARINKYLSLLGIEKFANRSPRTFSAGELKRAAIARALCRETPIILLDEPFTHIDIPSSTILEEVISNLPDDSTVIFSTHELSRANRLADTVITLEAGKLSPWTPENLFRMTAYKFDDGMELVSNGIGNGNSTQAEKIAIYYPGDLREGSQYMVSLNPKEVIVSKEPVKSSAQNSYRGSVRQIKAVNPRSVHVTVECPGNFPVSAVLTERAMREFGISVGDKVWVHFKSSAVYVHE
jgi:molybdopterin-binding protein